MSRTPFIAGNWKLNKTIAEAEQYIATLLPQVSDTEGVEVAICPSFTALQALVDSARGSRVGVFAQNMHEADCGAFTGEVSAPMLAALRCAYVVVGHSERRQLFGEADDVVARKAKAVFAHGMVPIVCVGETLEEREAGQTDERVASQIEAFLPGLTADQAQRLVVAYEPIWAIGTGRNATAGDAGQVAGLIRKRVEAAHGEDAGRSVRIQYGGSVKPGNIREFMAHPDIDGALVGGASLDPEEFALIVKYE